jgi:hypothetical protein
MTAFSFCSVSFVWNHLVCESCLWRIPHAVNVLNNLISYKLPWSDAATAGNFRLELREQGVDWLNYIKDTERFNVTFWSRIEPNFESHYDIQIQIVDNEWDFSILKQKEHNSSADVKLED